MIYLLILLAFGADRVTKWWIGGYLSANGTTKINNFLTLRETYNSGLAFGLFQGVGPLVGWLSILILVGLFVYLHTLPAGDHYLRAGIAILIGGALGNMVDRIIYGRVLDFIETPLRQGIFNVADVMIYIGFFLILIGVFWGGENQETELFEDTPVHLEG